MLTSALQGKTLDRVGEGVCAWLGAKMGSGTNAERWRRLSLVMAIDVELEFARSRFCPNVRHWRSTKRCSAETRQVGRSSPQRPCLALRPQAARQIGILLQGKHETSPGSQHCIAARMEHSPLTASVALMIVSETKLCDPVASFCQCSAPDTSAYRPRPTVARRTTPSPG